MKDEKDKYVIISVKVKREKLKEYKKWLIDNDFKSMNQHLNFIIDSILEKSGKDSKL